MAEVGIDVAHTSRQFAGLWRRGVALLFDFVVLSLVFFPVTRVVKGTWLMSATDHRWNRGWFISDPLCLAFLVVIFLYFVLLEWLAGGTVGKRLAGLRVVGVQGSRVGLRQSVLRNVLRFVDGLPAFGILGAVLIATSNERTRFGDRIARTRVVRMQRQESQS